MNQPRTRLNAALLLSTAAFLAAPALAQVAAPVEAPVAPPPIARTAPPGGAPIGESATPINAEAAAQAAAEDAAEAAERRPARRARTPVRRAAPVAAAPEPAVAAEPTPAASPSAVTSAPPIASDPNVVTEVETPAATPQPQPAPTESTAVATSDSGTTGGTPMWPLALLAVLVIAGGLWFILSRRRKAVGHDEWADAPLAAEPVVYHEPVAQPAVQPTPAAGAGAAGVMIDDRSTATPATHAAPIDAAPVVAEDATVATPDTDDVAALTAADTAGTRPWLEFSLRAVRAGTSADEALVEIELTVANAGNSVAEDVRISTFMLPAGNDGDLDRMLVKGDDTAVAPLTIAAGDGTRVDATLAMTRASLPDAGTFQPVVVADARYRLPDGGEGRTSAAFLIGGTADGGTTIEPIDLETRLMREDVGAQLYRDPVRV